MEQIPTMTDTDITMTMNIGSVGRMTTASSVGRTEVSSVSNRTIPRTIPPKFMLEDDMDFDPTEGSSTTEQKLREWRRARLRNVFPHLVDRAAFIDTIRLSVDTTGKAQAGCLAEAEDQSILRPGSTYSHKIEAKCRLTGNPVRIQYGKV